MLTEVLWNVLRVLALVASIVVYAFVTYWLADRLYGFVKHLIAEARKEWQ